MPEKDAALGSLQATGEVTVIKAADVKKDSANKEESK